MFHKYCPRMRPRHKYREPLRGEHRLTRKEQAALSRQKLMDAAEKLITEKGYHNTSITDITSACNMSSGNFYHYFKSKQDIISQMERAPFIELIQSMDAVRDRPVLEQLRIFLKARSELTMERYGYQFDQQWYIYHLEHPVTDDDSINKMDKDIIDIELLLQRGVENGELPADTPVHKLALHAAFAVHGAMIYNIMTEGEYDVREWADEYADTLEELLEKYLKS